jgi:uncharacterized protein YgiB involved in biofilm formation
MSKSRRTRRIALVLIGTAALPACMPAGPRVVHDRYASLEDCSADWGRPDVCDQEQNRSSLAGTYGGPRIFYRGPSYPEGDRPVVQFEARQQAFRLGALDATSPGFGNHAIEQSVPSRGGFGSSAHSFGRLG